LKTSGINPERVVMEYCTSAEGDKFQKTAIKATDAIKKLGKNPLNKTKTD